MPDATAADTASETTAVVMDSTRVTIAALLSLRAVWVRVVRAIDPETEQWRCRAENAEIARQAAK